MAAKKTAFIAEEPLDEVDEDFLPLEISLTSPDFLARLTSRKFLVTVLGAVIILLSGLDVIPLADDNAWQLIAILLTYVGIEGAADLVSRWRQGQLG